MKPNFWRSRLRRIAVWSGILLWGTGFSQQFADEVKQRESPAHRKAYDLNHVGLDQVRRGEYRKAVPIFQEAIQVKPDYVAATTIWRPPLGCLETRSVRGSLPRGLSLWIPIWRKPATILAAPTGSWADLTSRETLRYTRYG